MDVKRERAIKLFKRFFSILLFLLLFSISTTNISAQQTVFDQDLTDCSGQGGNLANGAFWTTHGGCANTVGTSVFGNWWDGTARPGIHLIASPSDTINISVNTTMEGASGNYYVLNWGTTYIDWSGFLDGAWFGCTGNWGCSRITQWLSSVTGSTDYYFVGVAQCDNTATNCIIHLRINCNSCRIDGNTSPIPTATSSPTPTPTESPTSSPSPSPTPTPTPTPIPVTKVFFIPGLGASWNANAFANCQFDPDPSHWSLASYAESIYNPILQAISQSGWNLYPFYYDWRAQVVSNTGALTDLINQDSQAGEKVNLVGHSMGGLLGREYLESAAGEKLNSLLTVGTPHGGSALAYPAWAGGEVWNDNFLAKTAITLYLKHCGGLFSNDRLTVQNQVPSVQNLLPTESYLQKVKSNLTYLPTHTINQNNLLFTPFTNPWGTRIGTISGTGFSTLNIIQTKDASQKDMDSGNWLDGKPNGKLYSSDGDGTVLSSSAILPDANYQATLNQNHTGLVNSVDGMTEILTFLGNSPTSLNSLNAQTSIEPNSALILIGYPANFWVTDNSGDTKYDKDGMVSFINPKAGSYKLNLLPKSGKTLFIVAQFLPNGQTLYKEYNFSNFLPKFKTIKFDRENPKEDILN